MTWLQRVWRRGQMEEQLGKELRFHMEQHAADLIARGEDPALAWREARLALGGPEQVKEECRDARGTRWLEEFLQDIRYALRTLRKAPGFAAVALLTLALGIGATTIMFTMVNGVLLKPLPFPQPDRLLAVNGYSASWNAALYGEQNLAHFDFLDCQRLSQAMDLAGWLYNPGAISEPGEAEYTLEIQASANFFSVMGVPLYRGRAFLPDEDRPGGAPVAILGYGVWQRRFSANPAALGSAVVIDGKRYTVVGIAPANFQLDGTAAGVYTPMGQNTAQFMQVRGAHPVAVIARLRPGATLHQAQRELAAIGQRLATQYADTNRDRTFRAAPLRPNVGDVPATLWLLLGAVGMVLLIACANIASLLLARAVSRERELAMRVALGAGRLRLVRQCLTESAVLGLCGGLLGIVLAAIGLRPFLALWPGTLPRAEQVALDWRVLLFAIGISLCSGALFGVAPALRVPARHLEQTLRAGARGVAGSSRRWHGAFVVTEIALAVVLLVAAGMLGRTLLRLSSLNPGVNIHNVLTARVALAPGTLADPAKIRVAWQDILEHAQRVPGVQAISMVDTVPMRQGNNQIGYGTTATLAREDRRPIMLAASVTPDYLKVMGIPLLQGRFFNDRDQLSTQSVAVIDDVMARQAFDGQPAIGRHLWIGMGSDPVTVVGVVGHVRQWGLGADDQAKVRAQLYYPFAQVPDGLLRRWSELMSIAVRTGVEPLSLTETLRRAVRGAGNDQVLYEVQSMEQLASDSLSRQRFLMLLFAIFAGLALLLACIGIYGVLAYLTGQRVAEMGVRMALGASAGDVQWLVLRQSLGLISMGVAVGTGAAIAAGRILEKLVQGMQPMEPLTFAVTIAGLVAAAMLASFVPAHRAGRIEPMRALRQD